LLVSPPNGKSREKKKEKQKGFLLQRIHGQHCYGAILRYSERQLISKQTGTVLQGSHGESIINEMVGID
jgi:hypothetical protein